MNTFESSLPKIVEGDVVSPMVVSATIEDGKLCRAQC